MQQGNIKKALDNLDNAGYRLRCAREYMGLSEKEAADELKLMVSHVRAIEQNRSEYLVQRKPFERYLRAYARLVQLNPDAIVDMYFAKSAPKPTQPVDITTRLEIPPQPVVTPPAAGRWQFAGNNYYHPAILGTGFLVIGLSLFAGWGVKQLVGGSQTRPLLAQNDLLEVRASTRKQPVASVAALPELSDVRFEKPVTSVPPVSSAELNQEVKQELEPIAVALKQRVVAEASSDELPGSASTPVASKPVQVASQNVELQNFTVAAKQRPNVELRPVVVAKAITEKPVVAAADVSQKLPANDVAKASVSSKAKPAVPAKRAEIKPIALAGTKTDAAVPVVTKPSLPPPTTSSDREGDRTIDDASAEQMASQNTRELNVLPKPGIKSSVAPTAESALAATSQPKTASLQPLKVTAKQRIVAQPIKVQETAEAEDLQQVVAAESEPLPESVTLDSRTELGLGPDLDDEAPDLDAVINDAVEDTQPFETALANSSDSASVARLALLESYKSTLRRRVYENVTYPSRARRRNQEGKVVMSATVSRGGELLSVEMAEASRYGALNRASEKAIKEASPFPAAPDTLSGESFVLTVPVVFKVPAR